MPIRSLFGRRRPTPENQNAIIRPENVEHDNESSLRVTMCRYNDGKLERALMSVSDTKYFAISHVWGNAEWLEVPGIDWEVKVSHEKKKFMAEKLNSIVGSDYFWMDILCVDQRDKAERIAVTQHIPTIFRLAQRTIMVRDGSGIRDCCVRAMGNMDTWVKFTSPCRERLVHHHKTVHEGEEIEEAALTRLWVLQEAILSDNIQFVRCDDVKRRRNNNNQAVEFEPLTTRLMFMGTAWAAYGSDKQIRDADYLSFARAFFNCGFVSRTPRATYRPRFPTKLEFIMQSWSTRRTSKPRDFILAIMPQYSFYTLPKDCRTMDFAKLFVDCFHQIEAKIGDSWMAPLIMGRVDARSGNYLETYNIPEPEFLGDLVKLFLGPRLVMKGRSTGIVPIHQSRGYPVRVERAINMSKTDIIRSIQHCACSSSTLWSGARWGELMDLREDPDVTSPQLYGNVAPAGQQHVVAALRALSERRSGYQQFRSLMRKDTFQLVDPEVLLRSAALISCGLGLSAFKWSKLNLTPVFVDFHGKKFLAFATDSVLKSGHQFFLVEVKKHFGSGILENKRFGLVAWNQKVEPESYAMCLFPSDVDLFGWKLWKNWM